MLHALQAAVVASPFQRRVRRPCFDAPLSEADGTDARVRHSDAGAGDSDGSFSSMQLYRNYRKRWRCIDVGIVNTTQLPAGIWVVPGKRSDAAERGKAGRGGQYITREGREAVGPRPPGRLAPPTGTPPFGNTPRWVLLRTRSTQDIINVGTLTSINANLKMILLRLRLQSVLVCFGFGVVARHRGRGARGGAVSWERDMFAVGPYWFAPCFVGHPPSRMARHANAPPRQQDGPSRWGAGRPQRRSSSQHSLCLLGVRSCVHANVGIVVPDVCLPWNRAAIFHRSCCELRPF